MPVIVVLNYSIVQAQVRLDINNYDVGGVSINLHEGTGAGTTESFNVNYNNSTQFEVTYDGKVGINRGGCCIRK